MSAILQPRYTPEQYLEWERKAEYKSEYINGVIYAMSGASREHNLIVFNVVAELRGQLRGRPCEGYSADMRVKIDPTGAYVYPDVTIVCGEPQFEDAHVDTLSNPTVIIEVLSPSTEASGTRLRVRGAKAAHYRRIESLTDYVLIAQDHPRVEHFARHGGQEWLFSEITEESGVLRLDAIDCRLALSDIYDRVTFPTAADAPEGSFATNRPRDYDESRESGE